MGEIICPICEGRDNKLIGTWGEYKILRCVNCEVEFAFPFKQASAEEYDHAYSGGGGGWREFYRQGRKRRSRFKDFTDVHKVVREILKGLRGGKLLDAGCGRGGFLASMREYGFDVYGFDFSRVAVEYAKKRFGLEKVIVSSWKGLPSDWRDFNIITALEVLEHLDDPFGFVKKAKEILAPNGWLILSVPNRERTGERSIYNVPGNYPPNHLTRWSAKPLYILLERAGFQKIIIKPLAPPTLAIKEEIRFLIAPCSYRRGKGKVLTRAISEVFGRYASFFLRHFLWDKGPYILGIAQKAG